MPQGQKHFKTEEDDNVDNLEGTPTSPVPKKKANLAVATKRRCVSTACIACRRRKSKCDGNTPSCAACSSVYGTECIYDPNSDHRRKGVYKKDIDNLKTRNSTLQTLIQAILNYPEDRVSQLVQDIRSCESLDDVAARIIAQENKSGDASENDELLDLSWDGSDPQSPSLESDISVKMGSLRLDQDGQVRFIGATSTLSLLPSDVVTGAIMSHHNSGGQASKKDPMTSWTNVTDDRELVVHLINMYFTWHYPYFTTLSKALFFKDFLIGYQGEIPQGQRQPYCTPVLVNAMLALGCHFTAIPGSRLVPTNSATAGDHFFNEAKRIILENDEHEHPKLTTVQALALMSVREAGCGREARGWVYSGMSFRMACDLGLQLNPEGLAGMSDEEIDARKVTFWGCFLFDKCWSNYMGRMPQLLSAASTVPKYDVFPDEDSELWTPYTDNGLTPELSQAGRIRAVSLQIAGLCEISNDIMLGFYHPTQAGVTKEPKSTRDKKGLEMKKLVELHGRLEEWLAKLPAEMVAREGALMSVLTMHMFCQLLYLLLFRPFLKLNSGSAAFPANLSPRRICTTAATTISKCLRLYKRTYGLKQICNVVVYMTLSACTIHLINLPTKAAKRDIVQGVKYLEEISSNWLCAKRALIVMQVMSRKYRIELPEEAEVVLSRIDTKGEMFGYKLEPSMSTTPKSAPPTMSNFPRTNGGPGILELSPRPAANRNSVISPSPYTNPSEAPYHGVRQRTELLRFDPLAEHNLPITPAISSALYDDYFTGQNSPVTKPRRQGSIEYSALNSPQLRAALVGGNSPSMVTGFSHLENTNQHWWLRDQAELAVDLGNWHVPTNMSDGSQDGLTNGHETYNNGYGHDFGDNSMW